MRFIVIIQKAQKHFQRGQYYSSWVKAIEFIHYRLALHLAEMTALSPDYNFAL